MVWPLLGPADDDIVLEGAAAFEAAVTCAAVSAGLRQQRLEGARATTSATAPRTRSSLGQLGARMSRMIAPFADRAVEQDSHQCGLQPDWP